MFKRIFTLLLPVLFSIPVFAQTTFQINYDAGLLDLMGSVKQLSNGEYLVGGSTIGSFTPNASLMQVDANGVVVWSKSYSTGFFTANDFQDARQTLDGGYIATGSTSSGSGGQALLVKTNNLGVVTWAKGYGGSNSEFANVVKQTSESDHGYIIGGGTHSFGGKDSTNIYVVKTTSTGTMTWDRAILPDPAHDSHHAVSDIVEIASEFYCVGYTSQVSGGDTTKNIILFKLNAAGVVQWIKSFGDINDYEEGYTITYLASNELLISGSTDASTFGQDLFFMKTDLSGNLVSGSGRTYDMGFADISNSAQVTSSGDYLSIGWTISALFPLSISSYLLVADDVTGAPIINQRYTLGVGNILGEGQQTADGGYVIAGMTGTTSWDFHLTKTDQLGNSGCNQSAYSAVLGSYAPAAVIPTPGYYNGGTTTSPSVTATALTITPTVDCSNVPCTPPPNPTSTSSTSICQGQSATITASGSGSVTYNVYANSTGGTSLGSTPLSVSPSITTIYYVEAFNGSTNCPSAQRTPVTITVVQHNPAWTAPPANVCQGDPAITLTTLITGTTGGTFSGSGVSGNVFNPATAPTGIPITITYSVGASPCTETLDHTITVEPSVTATWNAPATICQSAGVVDLSTLITGTTGGAFSGPGVTGNNFDPIAAGVGTQSITYTVGNAPCQATSTQSVIVVTDVDPAWTSPGALCESLGSINLNTLITGTTGGTWSGTGVTGNTFDPTGLSGAIPVTYTVGSSPCSEISTQSITVTSAVSAAWTTPGTICASAGNVNLTALITGSPGGSWSGTGVTGTTFNPTGLTGPVTLTYSVGVTPCSDVVQDDIIVVADVNPAWTSPGAICEASGTVNLNTLLTGTPGGTWSGTGVTGNVFNPTGLSGAISITYSVGTSPCVEVSTQSISVTSTVSAEWTTPGSICEAAGNVNLSTLVTGNPGGSWTGTGVTGNTFNPTGLTGPVAITYNVGVTPCTDTKTYNITVVSNVDPTWTAPATICEVQGLIDLNTLVTGTAGGTWSGTNVNGNTFDPSGLSGSSVSITYTVGATPCVETSVHSITIGNVSAAWAAPDSICESDGVLSLTSLVAGTAGGTWSGAGVTGTSFNPVGLSGLAEVTYVVGTAPCIDSLVLEIPVKASPNDPAVTALADEICFGQSTTISATGAGAGAVYNVYSASTGGNFIGTTPLVVSPTSTTTYYVESESVSGCINLGGRSTITVTVNELPPANAGSDQTICSGSSAALTASGGIVYDWSTGATTASINVTPATGSWYSVIVTDNKGCANADSLFVEVFFPGAIAALNDTVTGENETVLTIDVADNDSQSGGVVHVITQPAHGTADVNSDNFVVYTPEGGYDGVDSIQYAICDSFCGSFCDTAWAYIDVLTFFIPSGISPNGDGVNDEFEIVGLFKFPQHHLQIFNRWGDLLYDAQPYNNDWHGQHNKGMVLGGDEVVEGTYFYIFYPNAPEAETKKGSIELRKQ